MTRRAAAESPLPTLAHAAGAQLFWTPAFGGMCLLVGHGFETCLPPHVHPTYVLGVVNAGSVRVTTGGCTHTAVPGSVIAIAPYDVHVELAAGAEGWSFSYLYPSEASIRAALGATPPGGPPILRFPAPVIEDTRLAAAISCACVHVSLAVEWHQAERLLCDVFRQARGLRTPSDHSLARQPRYRRGVQDARSLIIHTLLRTVTLRDLAEAAGLSRFRFCRVFRETVGLPPYAYFERVRVARAHDLLLHGYSVPRVAYTLGFADQSHLTRQFHRASFVTPGLYAAMARRAVAASSR